MKTIEIKEGTWHFWIANALGWKARREEKTWETKDGVTYLKGYNWVPNDFCSYSRRVMLGLLIAAALVAIVVIDLHACYLALVYWYQFLFEHRKLPDMTGMQALGAISTGIIGVVVAFVGIRFWWDEYASVALSRRQDRLAPKKRAAELAREARQEAKENTPPGDPFLGAWYTSFKDKVCFKIKVTK